MAGVRAESPIYDMLGSGVERAVENAKNAGKNVELLIISSNPSMPSIAKQVLEKFPKNKFLILDAYCDDEPKITTCKYNQYEMGYVAGYIAALVSTSDMKNANK